MDATSLDNKNESKEFETAKNQNHLILVILVAEYSLKIVITNYTFKNESLRIEIRTVCEIKTRKKQKSKHNIVI